MKKLIQIVALTMLLATTLLAPSALASGPEPWPTCAPSGCVIGN